MNRKLLWLLIFSLTNMAVAHAQAGFCPIDSAPNLVRLALNQGEFCELFAINEPFSDVAEEAAWGYVDRYGHLRLLESPPVGALLTVMELSVDSSGKFLMVYSAGEGHPVISVYALADVLDALLEGEYAPSLADLDPYPGYIKPIGWRGMHLEFFSDMPFERYALKGTYLRFIDDPLPEGSPYLLRLPEVTIEKR